MATSTTTTTKSEVYTLHVSSTNLWNSPTILKSDLNDIVNPPFSEILKSNADDFHKKKFDQLISMILHGANEKAEKGYYCFNVELSLPYGGGLTYLKRELNVIGVTIEPIVGARACDFRVTLKEDSPLHRKADLFNLPVCSSLVNAIKVAVQKRSRSGFYKLSVNLSLRSCESYNKLIAKMLTDLKLHVETVMHARDIILRVSWDDLDEPIQYYNDDLIDFEVAEKHYSDLFNL
jgi:hypothetical protein